MRGAVRMRNAKAARRDQVHRKQRVDAAKEVRQCLLRSDAETTTAPGAVASGAKAADNAALARASGSLSPAGSRSSLFKHENLRRGLGSNLPHHVHHMPRVFRGLLRGRVDYVQQQRRFGHFFERGAEGFHQRGRQIADETDRVTQKHPPIRRQNELPDRWIEGRKHARIGEDTRAREPVEQCRFAGVRVSDKADRGKRNGLPLPPLDAASGAHRFEIFLDLADALRDLPAIHLELGFAGTSRSDAAAEPGHLNAASGQPRQQIVQLREFHLQLTFPRPRAPGEDVENQLRAIDNLALECRFRGFAAASESDRDRR